MISGKLDTGVATPLGFAMYDCSSSSPSAFPVNSSIVRLNSRSPNERDTARMPKTRPCITMPPACDTRSFSEGRVGRWSSDSASTLPSPRWIMALLSPMLPHTTWVGVNTQRQQHAPALASEDDRNVESLSRNAVISDSEIVSNVSRGFARMQSARLCAMYSEHSAPPWPSRTARTWIGSVGCDAMINRSSFPPLRGCWLGAL
mmetsp:Transcript_46865/g.110329  ORF Transcript_46865/g.110329 Transcript_46865/m.110329 type:complete len:203 (-) Transcript_46865:1003-1611(-)